MQAEQDKLEIIKVEMQKKELNEKLRTKALTKEKQLKELQKQESEKEKQSQIEAAFFEQEQEAIREEKAAAAHTKSLVNAMNRSKGSDPEIRELLSNFQGIKLFK